MPKAQDSKRILVLIPAFNEEATVGAVVADVINAGFDVVVIDDGSLDATAEVARKAGSSVVSLPVNLGVGGALRTGFEFAVAADTTESFSATPTANTRLWPSEASSTRPNERKVICSSGAGSPRVTPPCASVPRRRVVMRYLARAASRATGTKITGRNIGIPR